MDYRDIDYHNWDVKISDGPITYFDPSLSYQATGYRPIDETHGLDFDPSWFTEIKDIKERTKKYSPYPFNSKPYRDFWTELGWRCREGYSVNGYTLTGDNYYFINFYKLLSLELDMAGCAREYQTPDFYVEQYKYFHYVELCRFYGLDGCTLKARGIGWSEINASMVANMYTWKGNTRCMISAFLEANVKQTIKKVFDQMDYNNANTEGGMRRLRQKKDTELFRRASHIVNVDGQNVERGHMSEVVGVVCDETRKMRGDRVSLLLMEESGCHIRGTKVIMADGSIKNVEDIHLGDKVMGDDGTPRTVIQLHNGRDMMYKITQSNGNIQIVNKSHAVYGEMNNGEEFIIQANIIYNNKQLVENLKLVHSNGDKYSFDIEEYGYDEYFGFSLDDNQLFLLEDFTICHNSWPQFEDAFEKAKALVEIQGKRVGTVLSFGTGGDKGANLAGLAGVFNDPIPSRVLGYKNRYNKTGEEQITGFFVPAYAIVRDKMDKRGYTPPEKGKEYFNQRRNALANNPSKYLIFCAEFCYTPEEALALEGDGRFNTELLTQQKSNIVNLKLTPQQYTPVRGSLEFKLADGRVDGEILGVEFIANPKGKVIVVEPPITPEAGGSYRNLYVMGIDGIDFGGNDTSEHTKYASDYAFVIKKRMMGLQPPMYVCFYRDRPKDIMECFRTTLKAILWYNCKALIEKTKTSFLTFMRGKKLDTKYMMRRPRGTMGNTNSGHSNEFGAPASESVIQHGLTLVDNYVEEYCDYLYYVPVIDELITYSYKNKRKFDYVAAMQMAELADEELSSCAIMADESQFKNNNKIQYVYGYYTDERGYKRKGKIPLKHTKRIEWEEEVKDGSTIYKSNPLYSGAISVEEDSLL